MQKTSKAEVLLYYCYFTIFTTALIVLSAQVRRDFVLQDSQDEAGDGIYIVLEY